MNGKRKPQKLEFDLPSGNITAKPIINVVVIAVIIIIIIIMGLYYMHISY
jgi:hypothetical protein